MRLHFWFEKALNPLSYRSTLHVRMLYSNMKAKCTTLFILLLILEGFDFKMLYHRNIYCLKRYQVHGKYFIIIGYLQQIRHTTYKNVAGLEHNRHDGTNTYKNHR